VARGVLLLEFDPGLQLGVRGGGGDLARGQPLLLGIPVREFLQRPGIAGLEDRPVPGADLQDLQADAASVVLGSPEHLLDLFVPVLVAPEVPGDRLAAVGEPVQRPAQQFRPGRPAGSGR
jgi:hypothetical protein